MIFEECYDFKICNWGVYTFKFWVLYFGYFSYQWKQWDY